MEQKAKPSLEQQERKEHGSILQVKDISKAYKIPGGKVGVLQHIDFEVHAGEFIAITGPSGSGKTTLVTHDLEIARIADRHIQLGEFRQKKV